MHDDTNTTPADAAARLLALRAGSRWTDEHDHAARVLDLDPDLYRAHPSRGSWPDDMRGTVTEPHALRVATLRALQDPARSPVHRVAADLLDDVDPDGAAATVNLPDGRTATLRVVYDTDSSIGEWIDSNGRRESHDDDVFGTFAHRGTDRLYGYPAERPRGFTGRARVIRGYGQGCERLDGAVWWEPPADVSDAHLPDLERMVRAWFAGDWFHVGFLVSVDGPDDDGGESALWGIEYGWGLGDDHDSYLRETVVDLLDESGLDTGALQLLDAQTLADLQTN